VLASRRLNTHGPGSGKFQVMASEKARKRRGEPRREHDHGRSSTVVTKEGWHGRTTVSV
jgi:hypothetical protein